MHFFGIPTRAIFRLTILVSRICAIALPVVISATALCAQTPSPKKTTPRSTQKSDPRFQVAEALLSQGRTEEAKREIQAQLAQDPRSIAGYNLLGIVCTSEKDFQGAAEAFEHALKLSPTSAKTKVNLGNLYMAENQIDLAEKEFREVLRSDPANSDAHFNLGLVLLAKNLPAEAVPHFQRVTPPTNASRFNLLRASLLAGRTPQALKVANDLSTQNPKDVQLHFTLGVLLASGKQFRPAQFELEKADALQPDTFEILYNLGQVYLRAADYNKAELILHRARALKPDSPDVALSPRAMRQRTIAPGGRA